MLIDADETELGKVFGNTINPDAYQNTVLRLTLDSRASCARNKAICFRNYKRLNEEEFFLKKWYTCSALSSIFATKII